MDIPNDPFILLSYVNALLRDRYSNLDDLTSCEGIDKSALVSGNFLMPDSTTWNQISQFALMLGGIYPVSSAEPQRVPP